LLRKTLCLLISSLCVAGSLSFAESKSAKESLNVARAAATPKAAVVALEKALPGAGAYRPWYLLDLARLSAEAGDWKASLSWSQAQKLTELPAELADPVAWWHAEALAKLGRPSEAAAVALARIKTGKVTDPLIYLAWFRFGTNGTKTTLAAFDGAFPRLEKTDRKTWALSRYLAALCAVREGDWPLATGLLTRFSPSEEFQFPDYVPWARYYLAYGLYRQGEYAQAVDRYAEFLSSWKNHPFAWQAATTAALAAAQVSAPLSGDGASIGSSASADPLPFAEQAVALAPTPTDRAASIMLEATILTDRKRFAEAERLVAGVADGSATSGATGYAARALFALAELAVRQKNLDQALDRWAALIERFPKDPLAEEALYRQGELCFLSATPADAARAADYFAKYRQRWGSGRFLDQALDQAGSNALRLGNVDLAILQWEDYLRKYPAGSAAPRVYGSLVAAYRNKKEYRNALACAKRYAAAYPAEAKLDAIDAEITELGALARGESAELATLEAAYAGSGGAGTAAGRIAALRLARRYAADYGRRADATRVLLEVTARTPKSVDGLSREDRQTFASAWLALGNLYREDGQYKKASSSLLTAGNLFAPIDGERSAESLYGAADSFFQSGQRADGNRTVDTLQKTWPDSAWSRRAALLLEE